MTDDIESQDMVRVNREAAAIDMAALAKELVASAAERGVELTGKDGLLTALTRQVLQTALQVEMAQHVGDDKHDPAGRGSPNSRNGRTPKTTRNEIGEVTIDLPRERAGTFEPPIVRRHQRRLAGFDEAVISLDAKGMTTGDIAAHLSHVYDTTVSRDLVAGHRRGCGRDEGLVFAPAGSGLSGRAGRRDRAQDPRGHVANRPVYVAIGISVDGERGLLGRWIGPSGG